MLPKIVITNISNPKDVAERIGVSGNKYIFFDGENTKIDDLRRWVNSVSDISKVNKMPIILWNADSLSAECQSILLKPLEEYSGDYGFNLVVKNENALLPTIISRCVLENFVSGDEVESVSFWNDVRKCWAGGPSACIALSDNLDKDEAKQMIKEVILKMKESLTTEVSQKRLKVINLAITCLSELEGTNVNHKLCVDNFLISSWRLTKA